MNKPSFQGWHIIKRAEIPTLQAVVYRAIAILLAMCTGALFISALGFNPLSVYGTMITGALGSQMTIYETVKVTIPLLVAALGTALAFKMRFWNIGGRGQLAIGAVCASYFALFHEHWPMPVLLLVMALAAIVGAGLFGLIPAYFKARFGTNETLLTLMLNYIAVYLIQFLREGPWKNPADMGFPKIARFGPNAVIPKVLGVHAGWIVALALVALVYLYLRYTKHGYEISVVGENPPTARYAGMDVKKIIMRTMFISAAICGLAGMLQVAGADRTLTDSVGGGAGFTAIIVAWLSKLNPLVILIVSALFGIMIKGSGTMQSTYGISTAAADVLQGILLFFVLGSEFFFQYRIVRRREGVDIV